MSSPFIDEVVKEFEIEYISQYRWVKDRINHLSGEDFFRKSLELQRQMIIEAISKRELEMGENGDCTGNDYLTAKQLGLDEAIEIITL